MVDHHPSFCAISPFITGESYLRWMATMVWGKDSPSCAQMLWIKKNPGKKDSWWTIHLMSDLAFYYPGLYYGPCWQGWCSALMNPTIKIHFTLVEAGLSVKVDPDLQVSICTRLCSIPGLNTCQADDDGQHGAASTEQEAAAQQTWRVHRMLWWRPN